MYKDKVSETEGERNRDERHTDRQTRR